MKNGENEDNKLSKLSVLFSTLGSHLEIKPLPSKWLNSKGHINAKTTLIMILIGIVIGVFIGFISTEVDWAETYRNWLRLRSPYQKLVEDFLKMIYKIITSIFS